MRLHRLLAELRGHSAAGTEDAEVTAITEDSRAVQPGTLFVAVPGTTLDGAAFIGDAVRVVGHPSVLRDRTTASTRMPTPHAVSASRSGHSTAMPTPFRKMPRTIVMKYRRGTT
jgi:UDP-N-acetylmuramoyl-L-alanyl-D-glutamate--2,6-diaminopimelate ligase